MKILVKTFAMVALSAMTFISNATVTKVAPKKAKTFEVGMFQSGNSLKMNVMIEKSADQNLFVVFKDSKGDVLIRAKVSKKDKSYHGKFDLTELEDGKYTFEFTKETKK
jgi:hypothetical protein